MRRCIAYYRSRACPHAWRQCKNRAESGGFCRTHLRVISGVYLGLALAEVPRRRRAPQDGAANVDGKERNGAAAR
jgi:hypothetical protein